MADYITKPAAGTDYATDMTGRPIVVGDTVAIVTDEVHWYERGDIVKVTYVSEGQWVDVKAKNRPKSSGWSGRHFVKINGI